MSVEPPSSGRPTEPPTGRSGGQPAGPPSGPLSGPSEPPSGPSGPPSQPPTPPPPDDDSADFSDGGWEPRRPWWRSAPRVALITTAVVAVTALALVLTLPGGDSSSNQAGEVFMLPAGDPGPDGYTESPTRSSASPASIAPSSSTPPANTVPAVDGGQAGLYGGTLNVSSCDVEHQIKALTAVPAKNRAFAGVAGVTPSQVPAYLRSLTPVQLRLDTRVTNHGYRDGAATTYQAVLQAGTAVLIDAYGVPKVRCACGNPLTPPVAQQSGYKRTGTTWPSYSPSTTVVVSPSKTVIDVFVLYDPDPDHHWIARPRGDDGHKDRPTKPPAKQTPSIIIGRPSPSTGPGSPTSPSMCVPPPGNASGKPSGCVPPSSSGTSSQSPSPSPSSQSPSSEAPSSESPASEAPGFDQQSPEPPPSEPPSSAPRSAEPPGSGSAPGLVPDVTGLPESSPSSLAESLTSSATTGRSAPAIPAA
ncbi:DUF6777 domain-containing protein [Streptomyces sp. NPDC006872]|uniref:DUF6777 domain-containing protein n=1 Tax=Streptomyces sp. NPDC006872 TaxID=3155720 RepID=UPI0033F8C660